MEHQDMTQKKVFEYIRLHNMLVPGDTVIAGISGGADSLCLLLMLMEWSKVCPLTLHVVHVDHGIRLQAKEDAAFVRTLCEQLQIPFTLVEENVPALAAAQGCSEEEMGRKVRYQAFERVAERLSSEKKETSDQAVAKIAVAHHQNDQAETMLFHLFRGSGLTGLGGIRPVRGRIIRPLLCLEREEIENYLRGCGMTWCWDATNETDDYARNRIRHHILDYARKEINPQSVSHMARTAQMLQELEGFLDRVTEPLYQSMIRREGAPVPSVAFSCEEYQKTDPVIGKRLLYRVLCELSPGGKDIGSIHVQKVQELLEQAGNRQVSLPYGITARRQYDLLILEKDVQSNESEEMAEGCLKCTSEESAPFWEQVLDMEACKDGSVMISLDDEKTLEFRLFSVKEPQKDENIPKNRYTKWFDYDKIKKCLMVRKRQKGDFLSIRSAQEGTMCHKSLKSYLVDQKIPASERDEIPLLADGNHILWVMGHRISEEYKVSESTRHILQVQFRKVCQNRETEDNDG